MANITDYLQWRGDLSFNQSPFNEVDNLILSVLAYVPFDGIISVEPRKKDILLSDAAYNLLHSEPNLKLARVPEDIEFLKKLAETKRFGSLYLTAYINRIDTSQEKQFSSLTIDTGDGAYFIAYRGTDNTLVGWKEDFNMSFTDIVPSQQEAVVWLQMVARILKGPLRIGGHSKGGNLAAYAASFCDPKIQRRILAVYNNDGPGFNKALLDKHGYLAIKDRLCSFVPESSVIGLMLEHEEEVSVVSSSRNGIMQHDPYSWELLGPVFLRAQGLSEQSRFIDRTLKDWVNSMETHERKLFIDSLYELLTASGATTVQDLASNWAKQARALVASLTSTDAETRKMMHEIVGKFFQAATQHISMFYPFGHKHEEQKKEENHEKSTENAT
jgi:hypothetical protein